MDDKNSDQEIKEQEISQDITMEGLARGVADMVKDGDLHRYDECLDDNKAADLNDTDDDMESFEDSHDLSEGDGEQIPVTAPATEDMSSVVEAILFVNERPVEPSEVAEAFGKDRKEIQQVFVELQQEYEHRRKGLRIISVAGGYQMRTAQDTAGWVRHMYKDRFKRKLSPSAMEVLAIIAYRQPVTKLEIESIRGVDCDGVVKTLLNIGLIKIKGRRDVIGRPFMYGTSDMFLEQFGLNSLKDMPEIEIDESVFALEKPEEDNGPEISSDQN